MASPPKPGSGGGDWLGFFWRVGSMAAKKTMTRLREEYVAGREGRPEPARTPRPPPAPPASDSHERPRLVAGAGSAAWCIVARGRHGVSRADSEESSRQGG